jgi:CIC family chloride channel protein
LGGGASGGVFAPSLFMGAMLGSLMGSGFNELFSGSIAPDGAFAVVGMAALFAAAARAPITALFIVFEMTRDYSLILPLMVGVATATAAAQIITRDTVYSIKLHRIGYDVNEEDDEQPMDRVTVSEAMTTNVSLVRTDSHLEQMAVAMARSRGNVLAVTDEHGAFQGLVSATDLTAALDRNDEGVTAVDIAVQSPIRVYPDDTLREVVSLLAENDVRQVPVVARWNEQRLLGMMTQRDVLREFARRGSKQTNVPRKPPPVRRLVGAVQIEMSVEPESHLAGVELRNLPLPQEAVITTIHRDGVVVIPRGTVTLEAGDLLTILSEPAVESIIRELLAPDTSSKDTNQDNRSR